MDSVAAKRQIDAVLDQIETVIVGKREVIQLTLAGMLAGGHILFEDMPGVGKTTLARALAKTLASPFQRIQFTPDLLPSDIVGVSIFNRGTEKFEFQPGPVFTTFLLADEINRATPRTQAALLEAMGERRVTLDGRTHELSADFFVMATQNPNDFEGTYPLPEAQLDRFLMRLMIGYPTFDAELSLLNRPDTQARVNALEPLLSIADVAALKEAVKQVTISESLLRYMLQIATATRTDERMRLGVSPRGVLALESASRALALTEGRDYVTVDDIQRLVPLVYCHRVLLHPGVRSRAEVVLGDLMRQIPAPTRG
ncbi:AAA family ATPase [Lacticaseibacillus mingshuiensis]|uniref:AAA family ATPase n=1 Tax=Lacticaseibacillus mingshuiensis TaxID=2799574 RepID=A0ABW4CJ11_9LACO|nr:MoxR family ATPase [Lacticaseibacillus mingshuiensis]